MVLTLQAAFTGPRIQTNWILVQYALVLPALVAAKDLFAPVTKIDPITEQIRVLCQMVQIDGSGQ